MFQSNCHHLVLHVLTQPFPTLRSSDLNCQNSLLIATASPVSFMAASAAQARDVSVPAPVAPATSVPGTTVNAAIVTAITAPDDANLKLTVPSAGVENGRRSCRERGGL